jgi:Amt family ammonium transporter
MVVEVKKVFGYDDTLDVFGIHGVGGAIGAIATGLFATSAINPIFKEQPVGLIDGNSWQVLNQAAGILIAAALASIGTLVILKIVDTVIGLRVSPSDEIAGLDATQHGEIAYVFDGSSSAIGDAEGSGIEDMLPGRKALAGGSNEISPS